MAGPFRTKIKVRFGDVDRAGIAYYPRIVGYFHFAFEEFWEDYVGIPYHEAINKQGLGFPTVGMHVDFVKPLNFGEVLTAEVSVLRVGRSSVDFQYILKKGEDVCVKAKLTQVAVDMKTFKAKELPPALKQKFQECTP